MRPSCVESARPSWLWGGAGDWLCAGAADWFCAGAVDWPALLLCTQAALINRARPGDLALVGLRLPGTLSLTVERHPTDADDAAGSGVTNSPEAALFRFTS